MTPEITCPYCGHTWDEDCDVLRIWIGADKGTCPECDKEFYITATEVIAERIEDET